MSREERERGMSAACLNSNIRITLQHFFLLSYVLQFNSHISCRKSINSYSLSHPLSSDLILNFKYSPFASLYPSRIFMRREGVNYMFRKGETAEIRREEFFPLQTIIIRLFFASFSSRASECMRDIIMPGKEADELTLEFHI